MNRKLFHISDQDTTNAMVAVILIGLLTGLILLIGRERVGAAVIPLLYLLPVTWSASRWGPFVGIVSAIVAAAVFEFFFIPPYLTFVIGSLEGWLVLSVFFVVAVFIVGRIHTDLIQAIDQEKEAIFMYELSSALAGLRTPDAVARLLAERLEQLYQAACVQVTVYPEAGDPVVVYSPSNKIPISQPDLIFTLMGTYRVEGEVSVWKGRAALPARGSRLIQAYATQGALALERSHLAQIQRLSV